MKNRSAPTLRLVRTTLKIGQHQLANWSAPNRNLFINPLNNDVIAKLKLKLANSTLLYQRMGGKNWDLPRLSSVTPSLSCRPADEVAVAIKGANPLEFS